MAAESWRKFAQDVLYLPTNRLFIPEIENVAQARGVALESIRDRLAQNSAGATSTISAIASVTRRTPMSIFNLHAHSLG